VLLETPIVPSKAETQNMASSYDETWDDSALIDSWNEALEEYKVEPAQVLLHFTR